MTGFLVAALIVGTAACSNDSSRTQSAAGGTLVISVGGDPESLLPVLASTVPAKIISDLVYDRLAEIGDSLNTVGDQGFEPRLAKSWSWASDSLSIAFHLDPAARWHDGKPVHSDDVLYTWRVYSDSSTGSPFAAAVASIDSVTTPDSLTALFWFGERSPLQFYDAVNAMSVLPAHLLDQVKGPSLRTASLSRAPVGTGRFRFVKWTPGQAIELAADTTNYRSRPGLDRVIMTIAPDFNTALTRLLGGEADMIEQVPASSVAALAKDTSLRSVFVPGLDYNFVQFNLKDPRRKSQPHPLFGDRSLRRALTAAVDRGSIVRSAYDSLAQVALGPTVRAYPTTDTTLRQIVYSPDFARRTLDSLGWKDADGDGIRERGGRRLEFKLAVPGSSKGRSSMAVLIQEQLRQVGAKVDIDPLDFAAFIDRETRRDFDAVIGGWHVEPSPGGIRQTWGTRGSRTKSGSNYGSYENALFDAQVDSALASGTLEARRAHFTAAYQTIIDDAPAIWLAEPRIIIAVHKRLTTKSLRPDAWWASIADWTIPPDRRIARDRIAPAR
ncbi:MAG TPA: peptide ABC transporter substrate-binding protein [Gemmatimonadaceae bacterium]|nr:peptide ABC transporter substrate-binding protein [Gemmatimonadaceae bacterium]